MRSIDYSEEYSLALCTHPPEVNVAPHPGVDPDDSLWSWLAYDLRRYRECRGMPQSQVAKIIHVTKQQVHNLESGIRKPNKDQVKALDAVWDTGGHFARLRKFAEAGHDPDWFRAFTQYEAKARSIKTYTLSVVHGLLQTPDYARALFVAGGLQNVDAAVEARMARQEVLTRSPEIWALLNESVLDQPVGGAAVMRAQLAHLMEFSERPNAWVRVIPRRVGAHMGLDGSFTVISTRSETVTYLEAFGGGRLAQETAEVAEFALRFDRIGADAMSRTDSRAFIGRIREAMR
ncbi:helix-turn-helix transcriptional regulator [Actinomadura sp. 21ATH]|uniref:helix-turn-helix domain-containing protein n=1 Tax=Actinomadura sp. 21ATH TaxID=1735444 RepID=UPI0035BEE4ED